MTHVAMDRRAFLRATGLTVAGVAGSVAALRGARPTTAQTGPDGGMADDPIGDLAAALDYDQDAIYRFVADEVAYQPYVGMLRGPRATLVGRAGNAADKAALLAALLDASLIRTRYIVGTLGDASASALASGPLDLDTARARARLDTRTGAPAPSGTPPSPLIEGIIDRLPDIDASASGWASTTIDATVRSISDVLAAAGIELPALTTSLPPLERDRHVWVQAELGTGWLDLDPTVAGTQAGDTVATPTEEPTDTMPDDLRHRIDLAVIVERLAGTGLVQDTVVEQSVFADELTDVPIALGHARPEGLEAVGVSLSQILTGGVRYQVILQVDRTAWIGATGLVISGQDPGVLDGDPGTRDGEATAEWLEVTVTSPAGHVETSRRTMFDRVGDEARLAGSIDPTTIPPIELVDLGTDEPAAPPELRAVHFLSVATSLTRRPSSPETATDDEHAVAALSLAAPMYHVARDATNARLALDRGAAIHLDGPNIVMHSYVPRVGPDGHVEVRRSLDLLHRSFTAVPVQGVAEHAPTGLLAGVTSHVAERLRMGEGLPADLTFERPGVSVGAIMERASEEGIGLRVVRGALPSDATYPALVAARLEAAVSQGRVAIVPERPVSFEDSRVSDGGSSIR